MATCLAMNPRDLNVLLIGYEGGVVGYNIQKGEVEKTFEMTLPPGELHDLIVIGRLCSLSQVRQEEGHIKMRVV
jgi:hypothetical protein